MKYIPILFNTEMVQAILDGRKTQTRRLLKPKYRENEAGFQVITNKHNGQFVRVEYYDEYEETTRYMKPPCDPDDILWVRETWCKGRVEYGEEPDGRSVPYIEQCTGDDSFIPKEWAFRHDVGTEDVVWRPSIHMPRKAARIFLRVTDVRVEHLCDMRLNDCLNEGVRLTSAEENDLVLGPIRARERFSQVWNSTIKPVEIDRFGWEANPWVWVITFERCDKPEGW